MKHPHYAATGKMMTFTFIAGVGVTSSFGAQQAIRRWGECCQRSYSMWEPSSKGQRLDFPCRFSSNKVRIRRLLRGCLNRAFGAIVALGSTGTLKGTHCSRESSFFIAKPSANSEPDHTIYPNPKPKTQNPKP